MRRWATPAALLVGAALLSGFTIRQGYGPHDEGLMLAWASRVAGGQWPYRDFWSNYAPGQTVVLAGLWKLFGPSLLVWRVYRVAIDAIVALLAWALVRGAGAPRWLALLAWLAAAGAMAFPTGPGPNPPALALGLGAVLLAARRPAWAGALAGLAAVFRPEIGAACALGAALPQRVAWTVDDRVRRRAALVLGVAAVVLAAALAPFAIVAPRQMWHQIVGFLAIQDLQRLPFPFAPHTTDPNKVLEALIPLICVVAAGVALAWTGLRRRWHPLLPLLVVGLLYLLGRTDVFHLVPLSVAVTIVLAAAVAAERSRAVRLMLIAGVALIALHGVDRRAGQLLHPPALADVPGPAGDGVQTSPADARALAALRAAVDRVLAPGRPLFVADPRHDLVRVGDPLLYTILDRPNPTRYDVMQPGVVTTAPVQREIVRELAHTAVVVRWLDPTASRPEPNGAGRSSGVHILDRYLAADFIARGRFGDYELLTRSAG